MNSSAPWAATLDLRSRVHHQRRLRMPCQHLLTGTARLLHPHPMQEPGKECPKDHYCLDIAPFRQSALIPVPHDVTPICL